MNRSSAATAVVVATLLACDDAIAPPPDDAVPHVVAQKRPSVADDPPAIFAYPVDDASLKIRSDRRPEYLSPDGTSYLYVDDVCGVMAKIFSPDDGNGSGDAVMDPDHATIRGRDRDACGALRFITIIFDAPADGGPPPPDPERHHGTFHNFGELWQVPVDGVDVPISAGFNIPRCNLLRFMPAEYPGSDHVLVSRPDEKTWHIRTQDPPNDKAWCDNDGRFYHLPFRMTVTID